MLFVRLFVFYLLICFGVTSSAVAEESAMGSGAEKFDSAMQPILVSYLRIQESLSKDSLNEVKGAAAKIIKEAKKLKTQKVSGEHESHYKNIPGDLKKAASLLGKATQIEQARTAFKKLSMPMAMWGTMSKPAGIDVLYCSKVKASWLQRRGESKNPYRSGPKMRSCGEIVGGSSHSRKHH
ncbi:MAG: DUF3347 domain-containing protein [Myxococcales bacterium]|nr:MAG: DUF3347 domain-containing protein [Myxococcales bacterium]